MNRRYLRQAAPSSIQTLVDALQAQQHLSPHAELLTAVMNASAAVGLSKQIALEALMKLGLEAKRSIGRLRSCELKQLARTMERLNAAAARV